MSDTLNFMQLPLAVWIQTFSAEPVSYQDLVDGIYPNEVLQQIDSRSSLEGIKNNVEDSRDKMTNWELLLKNIRSFYQDVLDCDIVMKPPNVYSICTHPESESSRLDVLKALHLLLGCAINCEEREVFIEGITCLPEDIQISMMGYIQQLKELNSNIIAFRLSTEELNGTTVTLYNHLTLLLRQRDEYLQEIKSLQFTLDEAEFDQSLLHSISKVENGLPEVISRFAPSSSSNNMSNKNHLVVEIAECKAKMRKLRHELEDRTDAVSELEDEVDELKQTVQKLKNENLELVRDARAAKGYQDELDIVREKASRCERLEAEVQRYKEKLNDLDFYKAHVEELRQDNNVLFENRSVMEEQLKAAHKRIEAVVELENELQKHKEQRDALIMECDRHRRQAQNLIEENARLESEKDVRKNAQLDDELQVASELANRGSSNSLYDQLSQVANSQVLRLELENQHLKQELEQMKENAMLENASKMLALEKENSRLAAKVEKFLEASGRDEQRCLDLERANQELTRERKNLEETNEVLKETCERQVKELEKENDQLSQMIQSLRNRSEKTNDLRVKDLESENSKLNESVKDYAVQIAQLEQEQRIMNRKCKQLEEEANRCKILEEENRKYELASREQKKAADALQLSSNRQLSLECELSALENENQKLTQTVDTLQKSVSKKENLELENASLTVELEGLKRSLQSTKVSQLTVTELENEKEKLKEQLKQAKDLVRVEKLQVEKVEHERFALSVEKQQLQKSLESSKEKIGTFEQELTHQEGQNTELLRKMEDLRRSCKHLEDVEKRYGDLESEVDQLRKDRLAADKENKKAKQSLLEKDQVIDDLTSKLMELEHENKVLRPLVERKCEIEASLCDLEQENLGLIQSSTVDKKTIGTLREDLVAEKIRYQQMQTTLDNLQRQLKLANINYEKSVVSGIAREEGNFKSLECKMEEVYEKRVRSQEEQIHLLEKRLEEYKGHISKLQSELEESSVHAPGSGRTLVVTQRYSNSPSATQDIINLKDHIIKLERMNATFEEESRNVKRQNSELQDHIQQLHSQNSQWQAQLLALQTQHNSLQSQFAKTEVENRTLLSENASLNTQNATFQSDCSRADSALTRLQRGQEELMGTHEALEKDLGTLQRVHDQLTTDHEALIVRHASLKDVYRGSKSDVKHLQQRCSELTREKEMIAQLKTMLEKDKESLRSESQHYESLHTDYIHVREDNLRLLNANDKVNSELQDCQRDLRAVKVETTQLKAKVDELSGENAELNKQISDRNAEHSKQVFRYEETWQRVMKLEEENRSLMMQMKLLITQNQDLLTKLLECKDQHILEQKSYLERMADLRSQKEKLEERFVEQYKRYNPAKTKQRNVMTANFMKKAKQMIKGKGNEQGNSGSGLDGSGLSNSPEGSSFGSGSVVPSSESLPMPDQCDVLTAEHTEGTSTLPGSDSRNQDRLARIRQRPLLTDAPQHRPINSDDKRSIGSSPTLANRSRPDRSSREISTNTADEKEDHQITLNEFLHECNRSPKSRRKLLVEKQVALDDDIGSVSDVTQQPLRPRQPTIHAVADEISCGVSKAFKSEMNIASQAELDRRFRTLPAKNGSESTRPRPMSMQVSRPRVRPMVPSRSISATQQNVIGHGIDRQQMQWCHQSVQPSPPPYYDQQTIPLVSDNGAGIRWMQPVRSQSFCDTPAGFREPTRPASVYPGQADVYQLRNRDRRDDRPSQSSGGHETDTYVMPSDGNRTQKNDLRPTKLRTEASPSLNQQQKSYRMQLSAPSSLENDRRSSDDAGLTSQYSPGNVRNLVHSFQQAVKPGSGSSPVHAASNDRALRPRSAAATPTSNRTYPDRTPSRISVNSQFQTTEANKAEANVCIVRPASGRSLPPNPNEKLHANSRSDTRTDLAVVEAGGPPTTRPSSAKAAKPSVYLDYGLL